MAPISPSDRALGDLLAARRILTLAELDQAVRLAEAWSVRLGDAILARNWITPQAYYQALAEYYDLPFVDLTRDPPDPALLIDKDTDVYVQHLAVPWQRRDGRVVVATAEPGPDVVLLARKYWGADVALVVASKFDIIWAVQSVFGESMSHRAVFSLAERDPKMSAQQVFTPSQLVIAYGLLTAFLGGLAATPITTLISVNLAMAVFDLGNVLFKGLLVAVGGGRSVERDYAIEIEARQLSNEDLPVFTILVPMFREPAMLPLLAESIRALDYPLGKLDIKIVLEAGDHETIAVAKTLGLEGVFEIILVP